MLRRVLAHVALTAMVLLGAVVLPAESALALTLAQQPAVGFNNDGRQAIFARSTNGTPMWSYQLYANGGWSGWTSLGGYLTSDMSVASEGAIMYVFALGNSGTVYYNRQTAANSTSWSGWISLGGTGLSAPTAVKPTGGNLQVFVRGTDNGLWGRYHNSDSSWTGWASWGKPSGTDLTGQPVAAAEASYANVYVFAKGAATGQMYSMKKPAGFYSGTWTQYGGSIYGDRVAVTVSSSNTLEVFRRVADGSVAITRQISPGGNWDNNWVSLGTPGGVAASDSLATRIGYNGRLYLYVVRDDGVIYYRMRDTDLTWASWSSMGGQGRSRMAAGRNDNGAGVAFVIGSDGRMYQNPQNGNNGSWPGFGYIDPYNGLLI